MRRSVLLLLLLPLLATAQDEWEWAPADYPPMYYKETPFGYEKLDSLPVVTLRDTVYIADIDAFLGSYVGDGTNTAKIGGGHFVMIAGPCSVESEEQILEVAQKVKESGAHILRGGAFKPRTSPYSFQGMEGEGIDLLVKAKKVTGLPLISEIMDISQLHYFDEIDVIQVGARNMQNFLLLKELGKTDKPILLKRGFANTIQEWLMSAEYIMSRGNKKVILCERGIRTIEQATRNTLDLSAIPVIKEFSHLPIVVDPSHATGYAKYVKPMSLAAVAAGADGLMIEVHNDPCAALCDGPQSITPDAFDKLARSVEIIRGGMKQAQKL